MKHLTRFAAAACLALGLFLSPAIAEASSVRLGLGGDYWRDRGGIFQFHLGVESHLAGPLFVGGRFGALVLSRPEDFGIPLDLVLRLNLANHRIYVEGLGGPWIFFQDNPVHAHVAFGFGIQGRSVSLGIEVGYLEPAALAGLRLGWRF